MFAESHCAFHKALWVIMEGALRSWDMCLSPSGVLALSEAAESACRGERFVAELSVLLNMKGVQLDRLPRGGAAQKTNGPQYPPAVV